MDLRRCQSRPLKTDFEFMSDRLEVKMSNRVKVTEPITENFANNQFRHGEKRRPYGTATNNHVRTC